MDPPLLFLGDRSLPGDRLPSRVMHSASKSSPDAKPQPDSDPRSYPNPKPDRDASSYAHPKPLSYALSLANSPGTPAALGPPPARSLRGPLPTTDRCDPPCARALRRLTTSLETQGDPTQERAQGPSGQAPAPSPSSPCARPCPRPPSPTLRPPSSPGGDGRPELRRDGGARIRGDGCTPRHQRLGRGHPVRPVGEHCLPRLP